MPLHHSGNLGSNERLISAGAGALLSVLALRGGPLVRLLAGAGAIGLVARAVAGHCGMKAALKGESSLKDGMTEQWHHMTSALSSAAEQTRYTAAQAVADAEKAVREQGDSSSAGGDWMSHQNGRVTGTGVTPGTGDSEAGTTARPTAPM